MEKCEIINFPTEESYDEEFSEPAYALLGDQDILNLFFGTINLIKKHASKEQLDLLVQKIAEARAELFC